jgi:hypothetical protein
MMAKLLQSFGVIFIFPSLMMYAQVDDEGNMFQLLLDHKKDGIVIDILDGTITSVN